MLEFLKTAHLELQPQEADEFQCDVLAVNVVIKIKQVDLDAQLRAIIESGTAANVRHALQLAATHMRQHSVCPIVRQQQVRVYLPHIGRRETQTTA